MQRFCLVATDDNTTKIIDFDEQRLRFIIMGYVALWDDKAPIDDLIKLSDDLDELHYLQSRYEEAVSKGFKWRYFDWFPIRVDDTILFGRLKNYPQYNDKKGVVHRIDDDGKLYGDWGPEGIDPKTDGGVMTWRSGIEIVNIEKNTLIKLNNGREAVFEQLNNEIAKTDIGLVKAYNIEKAFVNNKWTNVNLTPQLKQARQSNQFLDYLDNLTDES